MTSPCERLTNFFNPFDNRASRKRKLGDTEASSFVKREFEDPKASSLNRIVQNTRFPIYNGPCHFSRLGSQVVVHGIGSFLGDRDLVSFSNTNKELREQLDKILEIKQRSKFSSISIFDKKKYKDYWGVEITDEFEPAKIDKRFLRIFLKKYFGPNPIDPTKLVKDTCLIPTVVPVRVMVEGRSFDYNLNLLSDIASHPGIGENAATITYDGSTFFEEYGGEMSPQQAYLEIVLPGVIGRGEFWECQVQRLQDLNEQTGYGCEAAGPDVFGLTTAAFAQRAVLGGGYAFGDARSGMEPRDTYSNTRELVKRKIQGKIDGEDHVYSFVFRVMVGGFGVRAWPYDGNPELSVGSNHCYGGLNSLGVAVQWKCGPSELES